MKKKIKKKIKNFFKIFLNFYHFLSFFHKKTKSGIGIFEKS